MYFFCIYLHFFFTYYLNYFLLTLGVPNDHMHMYVSTVRVCARVH